MLAGTVALSIENARVSEELKKAYMEVSSLNRAKDRVISHLSHELKTPIAVLRTSLLTLEKRLEQLPQDTWKPTIDRSRRNLGRLLEMQYQVHDIMHDKNYKTFTTISHLLKRCTDELEALIAQEIGESPMVERIRNHIENSYGLKELKSEMIELDHFIKERLETLEPSFAHRQVTILTHLEQAPAISIPPEPLLKIVDGLLKNAIENTPDEGKIVVTVKPRGDGAVLEVSDYGIGITEENQTRIFEGFFTTQDTLDYSSKRPFDFNAGGKGADLLRMKIFSERYNFRIDLTSTRCPHIPADGYICPGRISECTWCRADSGCHQHVATTFSLHFPPAA